MIKIEKLGVDIGGVIINRINDNTKLSFSEGDYLKTRLIIPGSFSALQQIVEKQFGKNVFLVSKGGAKTQIKTRHWLDYHNFYKETRISPYNIIFCLNRKEKANICQELKITHFIDDRLEILSYLHAVKVKHLYLFRPRKDEVHHFAQFLKYVQRVNNWEEVLEHILS